ncbi:MAG TPA: ATP-binding protein, partial [Nitrososphaeraceae archaeon]|nr:ATP-binding protein [Nitrososphaeraceae archaeon]
ILFEPEEECINIQVDSVLLHTVVNNLLDSSIKLSNGEGTIPIFIKRFDDKIVVSIKIDEASIDSEIVPSLFTKFDSDPSQGIGLSLFLSKSIVEAHGGRIWADNNNNSNYRTIVFNFSLPVNLS